MCASPSQFGGGDCHRDLLAVRVQERPQQHPARRLPLLLRLGLQRRGVVPERQAIERQASALRHRHHLGEMPTLGIDRSEEHTSELQSQSNLVCRLLLEKKKKKKKK